MLPITNLLASYAVLRCTPIFSEAQVTALLVSPIAQSLKCVTLSKPWKPVVARKMAQIKSLSGVRKWHQLRHFMQM